MLRTFFVAVLLEPREVDYFQNADRIEENERDEPKTLLIARGMPEAETLPDQGPYPDEEENDDEERGLEARGACGRAEKRLLYDGTPHI